MDFPKYICLDIEATGLNNQTEDIIEVAAVKFNLHNDETETFHTLIHTDIEISNLIQNLTGINNEMLVDSPALESISQELIQFCQDLPIVGHNISFDTNFLSAKGINLPGPLLDTLPLSQAILEEEDSFSLEILCQKYNQNKQPSHRALDDVLANIELLKILLRKFTEIDNKNKYLVHQTFNKLQPDSVNHLIYNLLQNNNITEDHFEQILSTKENNYKKLTVCNTDLSHINSSSTLPEPGTIIEANQAIQNISQLSPEEIDQNFFLLLSLLTKVKTNSPLFIDKLNIKVSTPQFIKKAIQHEYTFFEQSDEVLCNYKTFFFLNEENMLNKFDQIIVEHDPYLVEGYLKSKEINININKLEYPSDEEINIIKCFAELEMILNEKVTDKESTYKFHVLDLFEKNDITFKEIIKNLQNVNKSEESDYFLNELLRNTNQYYVWLEQYKDYPVQIKAIPQNSYIEDKQILAEINHNNISIPQRKETSVNILNNILHDADLKSQDFANYVVNYIRYNFQEISHTGVIICPTKHMIKQIHESLSIELKEKGITLLSQDITGSKGKILQLINTNESPTILVCTHHFFLKFQPEIAKVDKAALLKMPIGLPSHKIYRILEKENPNAFNDLLIPQTAATIRNILIVLNQKYKVTSLDNLDTRLTDTKWGQKIYQQI